jgi:hypothetical protein
MFILRVAVVKIIKSSNHHRMHVVNELAEIMTIDDQEYEEVIEEYEEEFPEPPPTDFADTAPAQGKPRCITLIFDKYAIYIYVVHLCYRSYMIPTCIYILSYESY